MLSILLVCFACKRSLLVVSQFSVLSSSFDLLRTPLAGRNESSSFYTVHAKKIDKRAIVRYKQIMNRQNISQKNKNIMKKLTIDNIFSSLLDLVILHPILISMNFLWPKIFF